MSSLSTYKRHGITYACMSRNSGTTYSENFPTVSAHASLTMNYKYYMNKANYTGILKLCNYEVSNIINVFFDEI